MIARRVSQARLQYLDFIMGVTSLDLNFRKVTLERTLVYRLDKIRLETRKIFFFFFFEAAGVIQERNERYLMDFGEYIYGYSKGCQHPPAKDHQVHMFS